MHWELFHKIIATQHSSQQLPSSDGLGVLAAWRNMSQVMQKEEKGSFIIGTTICRFAFKKASRN